MTDTHVTSMIGACDKCRGLYPTKALFADAVIRAAKENYFGVIDNDESFAHLVGQYELKYGGV